MSREQQAEEVDIHDVRKAMAKSSIKRRSDGYEIVLASSIDDALTFFVSFPKSKLTAPHPPPTTSEPE